MQSTARPTEVPLADEGLICGFKASRTERARPISPSEIATALPPGDGVTWLHFRLADARAERFLLTSELMPTALRKRITEHDAHTVVEPTADGLMVVVSDFSFEHADDAGEAAVLWGFATAHSFVTARMRASQSADLLRIAFREGLKAGSGFEVVAALFEQRNTVLRQVAARQTDEVNEIEDEILRGDIKAQRQSLGRVRRQCARIRRHFAPEHGALRKLLLRPPTWMERADEERLRSEADELGDLIGDTNELYERAKLLQEELAGQLAEKTSDRLYLLSILTAVFLPMTLISGIFGMNVAGLPGTEGASGFFWSMVLLLGSGGLTLWLLRRKRLL